MKIQYTFKILILFIFLYHINAREYNMTFRCQVCSSCFGTQTCMFVDGGPFINKFWGCQITSNCIRFPITRRVYECSSSSTCSTCCYDQTESGGPESKNNCVGTSSASEFCVFNGISNQLWFIIGGIALGLVLICGLIACCKSKKPKEEPLIY